jgi:hypothetical protein
MKFIPLILHYQPTLHILTNLIQFCPILTGPYILAQNVNAPGPYILGRREYTLLLFVDMDVHTDMDIHI